MILSASRRTDIPAFYGEWMRRRLAEGYVLTRNPMNPRQVSRIALSPDTVEYIVFWTKDATAFLEEARRIREMGYKIGFQYTMNGYGEDVEPHVPHEKARESFLRLSDWLGGVNMLWRYDPIVLDAKHDADWHMERFDALARQMQGATDRCVFSFVDNYRKLAGRTQAVGVRPDERQMRDLAARLAARAKEAGMRLRACAEQLDFSGQGVETRGCIDREDVERAIGYRLRAEKANGQRAQCRCINSVDIGAYDSCAHGCAYCYANRSAQSGRKGYAEHDPAAPLLLGKLREEDVVKERKTPRLREEQLCFLME